MDGYVGEVVHVFQMPPNINQLFFACVTTGDFTFQICYRLLKSKVWQEKKNKHNHNSLNQDRVPKDYWEILYQYYFEFSVAPRNW